VTGSVERTGRLLVVDEHHRKFGLSSELAGIVLEACLAPRHARVCLDGTIPNGRHLEDAALPNVPRIVALARAVPSGHCGFEIRSSVPRGG
jgi:pyruvate/2-oxoglutarate/acetoin dehydrogenase E1 component